jgi:hypothetical protein
MISMEMWGGRKPTHLTSGNICKAISVVPSGGNKTDIHRENMDIRKENIDVRWVGFYPLENMCDLFKLPLLAISTNM